MCNVETSWNRIQQVFKIINEQIPTNDRTKESAKLQ